MPIITGLVVRLEPSIKRKVLRCAASTKAVISFVGKQIRKYAKEPLGTFFCGLCFLYSRACLVILFVPQIRKQTNTNKI